jgi:hypothetical protein
MYSDRGVLVIIDRLMWRAVASVVIHATAHAVVQREKVPCGAGVCVVGDVNRM